MSDEFTDVPDDIRRFSEALFDSEDTVLIRFVETWIENEKKQNRIVYTLTRHIRPTDLITPEAWTGIFSDAERERANVFFGVCPRVAGGGQFDLAWQIRTVRVLWADLDHCIPEEAVNRCEEAGVPRPSIIVRSGHGVHLYWVLDEGYLIDDVASPPPVLKEFVKQGAAKKKLVRRYVEIGGERVYQYHVNPQTGGDSKIKNPAFPDAISPKAFQMQNIIAGLANKIGGDHTQDLARLLRVPSTLNRKNQRNGEPPVPCELVACDSQLRYPLRTFEAYADEVPEKARARDCKKIRLPSGRKLTPTRKNRLTEFLNTCAVASIGDRSEADFAMCCWAIEQGLDKEALWSEAQTVGKFAERGRNYFDRTWDKAEVQVKLDVYDASRSNAGAGAGESFPSSDDESQTGGKRKESQAELLVRMIRETAGAELFHTPGGYDSEGYATIPVSTHLETWSIKSKGFRRWLGRLFYERFEKVPGSQALQDAVNVLAGQAIHDGPEHTVAVRVAAHDGAIYLDLANEQWEDVEISAAGWRVVTNPHIRFVRKRGQLALPTPVAGGRIDELRSILNLPDEPSWILFVAWLIAALRPDRPFPVLVVNGEQGSAKSTLCKFAKALIDPSIAPLRRPPREERDLMIAANNSWMIGYENLSSIPPLLSDAICALATGGGFSTRELYTDDDEKLFDSMRPIVVNGIEDLATRGDLLDRSIILTLPQIEDSRRRNEEELWVEFYGMQARVLGAFLDALSMGLRNAKKVILTSKPRMADFATLIVAAEPALGWPSGAFMAAYTDNRGQGNSVALESSLLTTPIMSLVASKLSWTGTAAELLGALEGLVEEKTSRNKYWPTSPRKLSGDLRRLAPNLRLAGIDVVFGGHSRRGNLITLEQGGKTCSPRSPCSPHGEKNAQKSPNGERGDGGERLNPHCSNSTESEEVVEWTG